MTGNVTYYQGKAALTTETPLTPAMVPVSRRSYIYTIPRSDGKKQDMIGSSLDMEIFRAELDKEREDFESRF